MRIAEVLEVDPERIERIVKGHVSGSLPNMRTYFRAKYDLSLEEIDEIERTVSEMQRRHQTRESH